MLKQTQNWYYDILLNRIGKLIVTLVNLQCSYREQGGMHSQYSASLAVENCAILVKMWGSVPLNWLLHTKPLK